MAAKPPRTLQICCHKLYEGALPLFSDWFDKQCHSVIKIDGFCNQRFVIPARSPLISFATVFDLIVVSPELPDSGATLLCSRDITASAADKMVQEGATLEEMVLCPVLIHCCCDIPRPCSTVLLVIHPAMVRELRSVHDNGRRY